MARKSNKDEARMVNAGPLDNLDGLTAAEIRERMRQIDLDTKKGLRSNEDAKKALEKAFHAAQYREREAAKPVPVALTEDQQSWLRECSRDRARKRARVGDLKRQIEQRASELNAYRRQRNAIVGDTFRLEEKRDAKTGEVTRIKVLVPGVKRPGTNEPMPTEYDSKIAELEQTLHKLRSELGIAEQRLQESLEAEAKARTGA